MLHPGGPREYLHHRLPRPSNRVRLRRARTGGATGPAEVTLDFPWQSGDRQPFATASPPDSTNTQCGVAVGAPISHRIGLALEWVGQLVVEAQLLELLGSDLRRWTRTTTVERQGIVVLRPLSDADRPKHIAEGPEEFQSALRSREPVVAWADVGQVRQDLGAWFGELADPATGGANAILSLCGALSDRSERLLLRNPAALGLEFEDREDALAAHLRAQTVRARAVGMSISDLRYESPGHHDLRLSSEAWNH